MFCRCCNKGSVEILHPVNFVVLTGLLLIRLFAAFGLILELNIGGHVIVIILRRKVLTAKTMYFRRYK